MAKSLLGGGAAMAALLSVSLFFQAQTSVAETLAFASQDQQEQQKTDPSSAEASVQNTETESVPSLDETGNPLDLKKIGAANLSGMSSTGRTGPTTTEANDENPSQSFVATAYSLRGRTASGKPVAKGIIAADRRILPLGTRVRIDAGSYTGEYLVADTGGAVRGRKIDVWVPSSGEAMRFGRRSVKLTVLTYGGRKAATRTRVRQ